MDLNKKIKQLRINKGITQEKLAAYLNISFQAVSKWENESSSPDISLLPRISSYFGVTIDELFTLNTDAHIERIENMLQNEASLSITDETYARNQLLDLTEHPEKKGDAFRLLAMLSNHKAKSYHNEAIKYAKKALSIEPNEKSNHVALIEASGGITTDWNCDNHYLLTEYYQSFTQENPDYQRAYIYLFDHLIADNRVEEANKVIDNLKDLNNNFRILWLNGRVEKAKGNHNLAFKYFDEMIESEPTNWITYAIRADEFASLNRYDEAISDNEKAFDLQEHPRYIDSHECRAIIYEVQGKYDQAIQMWKEAQNILKADWKITFGHAYDKANNEIERLKKLNK